MDDTAPGGRILVRIADAVATVQIDNQPHRNALTAAMCDELAALMPALDGDPEVALVVLRGAGATFSAGAAIDELAAVLTDVQAEGSRIDHLSGADAAITAVAKPTVALVDGPCVGGGWQIASACDFVVASARSIFAITPAKLGIVYPRLGVERLVREVGPATAKYLLLTGRMVSAEQARHLGLVAEVVPDEEFEAYCGALARQLLGNSRFSMHTLKALIDRTRAPAPGLDAAWEQAWAAMGAGPDMAIGVDAFLQHRAPRFRWRPDDTDGSADGDSIVG